MSWTPPPLDDTPFGADLATRVANYLRQGHRLAEGHRDFCGMGLACHAGTFHYAQVYDGMFRALDTGADDGGSSDDRAFGSESEFIGWLARQSDQSLARLDHTDPFYHRNQTLTGARLIEFVECRDAAGQVNMPRWQTLLAALSAESAIADRFFTLFAAYSEPHRAYHNARHIHECLTEFDRVRAQVADSPVLEAALWFHDLIYDAAISDNEARSAQWAEHILTEGGVASAKIQHVRALVLVTQTHEPDNTPDADWMCDIDLAILGQDETRFRAYEAAIRQEYVLISDAEYRAGRAKVLGRFLGRQRIYLTQPFFDRYEDKARENLTRSLADLGPAKRRWWFF